MCAPGCIEHVVSKLSRRGLLRGAGAAAAAATAAGWAPDEAEARAFPRFSRVVDLTHPMTPEFPTFFGTPGIALKRLKDFKTDGFNMFEWTVLEHAGTHIDAPLHFAASGAGPDTLPAEQLVVPLAVVDVTGTIARRSAMRLPARQRARPGGRIRLRSTFFSAPARSRAGTASMPPRSGTATLGRRWRFRLPTPPAGATCGWASIWRPGSARRRWSRRRPGSRRRASGRGRWSGAQWHPVSSSPASRSPHRASSPPVEPGSHRWSYAHIPTRSVLPRNLTSTDRGKRTKGDPRSRRPDRSVL
jgi:putative cyclase